MLRILFLALMLGIAGLSGDNGTKGNIETPRAQLEYFHSVKEVDGDMLILEEGTVFQIGWWYTGTIAKWEVGDRLKVYVNNGYSNNFEFENVDKNSTAWGTFKGWDGELTDAIADPSLIPNDPDFKVALKSGCVFKCYNSRLFIEADWYVDDKVFIYHSKGVKDRYNIWNLDAEGSILNWGYVDRYNDPFTKPHQENSKEKNGFVDVLGLEGKLNDRVLGQPQATESVAIAIINYTAGLKDPKTPIKVFLFLGPSGTGKTELAKALTSELYGDQSHLIRFEMSHFKEPHSMARLIGSPPGYVGYGEGGQLTEALKAQPKAVVLLDEIEKAHPTVRKVFLPVFDEGFITDSKSVKVPCNEVVFIMTSNICSEEISALYKRGYSPDEILEIIEPQIIEILSPELYGRMEPVVFRPLGPDVMERLVDRMLDEVARNIKTTKNIDLVIDPSVREFLIANGYNPALGARPLKNLIQKKVIATLSYAIISQKIPDGSKMKLFYLPPQAWYATYER